MKTPQWFKQIIQSEIKAFGSLGSINNAKELSAAIDEFSNAQEVGKFDYDKNIKAAYTNVIVHFCTNLTARAKALPRPELWVNGKAIKKPGKNSPLYGLWKLIQRPNPDMDWADLIIRYSLHLDLSGETFLRRNGKPEAFIRGNGRLELLEPSKVDIEDGKYVIDRGESKKPLEIPVKPTTSTLDGKKIKSREVLHNVDWDPNGNRGLSKLVPGWPAISNFDKGLEWNHGLLTNSARLGLLVSPKVSKAIGKIATFTQEQMNRLQRLVAKFTGARSAGKTLVFAQPIEVTEVGQNQKDLEFNIMMDKMAKLIALSLGVDPIFLGITGDSTYSNKDEAAVGLYKHLVLPWLELFSSDFEHWMKEIFPGDWELRFNLDDVAALEPIREKKWSRAIEAKQAELLTVDEARELIGYGKMEKEDVEELNPPADSTGEGDEQDPEPENTPPDGEE